MTHPDREFVVQPLEEAVRLAHGQQRGAVLARMPGVDLAAKVVGYQLHAVADAEHRDPRPKGLGIHLWSSRLVHAGGTSAEDQPRWLQLLQLGPRRRPRDELAVDARLPHSSRDQLAELRSEVEDQDGLLTRYAFYSAVLGGRGGH